jgi:hypothetical protein
VHSRPKVSQAKASEEPHWPAPVSVVRRRTPLLVVEGLGDGGVRLVGAGRAHALVLVVDVGRGVEELLQAAGAEEGGRAPERVDLAHLFRDRDVGLGRDLLADDLLGEDRRESLGPDGLHGRRVERRLQLKRQVRHDVVPGLGDALLVEKELGLLHGNLRFSSCVGLPASQPVSLQLFRGSGPRVRGARRIAHLRDAPSGGTWHARSGGTRERRREDVEGWGRGGEPGYRRAGGGARRHRGPGRRVAGGRAFREARRGRCRGARPPEHRRVVHGAGRKGRFQAGRAGVHSTRRRTPARSAGDGARLVGTPAGKRRASSSRSAPPRGSRRRSPARSAWPGTARRTPRECRTCFRSPSSPASSRTSYVLYFTSPPPPVQRALFAVPRPGGPAPRLQGQLPRVPGPTPSERVEVEPWPGRGARG